VPYNINSGILETHRIPGQQGYVSPHVGTRR
jgi:hypothetical protein